MIKLSKCHVTQAVLLLAASTSITFALPIYSANSQSVDRDNPTTVVNREIQGQLEPNGNYFYSFIAGPGSITITADLQPISNSYGNAMIQLYDKSGSNEIGPVIVPASSSWGSDRKTGTIQLATRQRVLLRITEGTGCTSGYRIRLNGAVEP